MDTKKKRVSRSSSKSKKKCIICGKPVVSPNSNHCRRHARFARCMDQRGIHAVAVKNIWAHVKRYGFVCYYTKTPLDMTNPHSPLYFVFDHMIPGDETSVVLTFALYNEVKSDLTQKEFRYWVRQINNSLRFGTKIRKKKLTHWVRLNKKVS